MPNIDGYDLLSKREKQVLDIIVKHNGDRVAASKLLFVCSRTMDTHLDNIRKKLDVKTTRELVIKVKSANDEDRFEKLINQNKALKARVLQLEQEIKVLYT